MNELRKDISLPESQFKVLVDSNSSSDSSDRATAQILALLDEFYEDIKLSRKDIKYDLTMMPSHEMFADKAVQRWVEYIIDKYNLDYRWILPLKTLILLDYLTLPDKTVQVRQINPHPDNKPGDNFGFEVTVSRGMSMKELLRQIASEGEWLEAYLKAIPAAEKPGIQINAMRWGSVVWALREFKDPTLSYQQIVDMLPDSDVPDRAILATYHKRFLKALSKHEPKS